MDQFEGPRSSLAASTYGTPGSELGAFQREIAYLRSQVETLKEESNNRIEKLKVLNQMGQAISSILDTDRLFERIIELTTGLLDCEIGSLMLVEDEYLIVKAGRGIPERILKNARIPMGDGIAGAVAQSGESLLIDNLLTSPRFAPHHTQRYKARSLLSSPIRLDDQILGVINVTEKNGGGFTLEDKEFLETIAGQSAIAIANARLHNQARRLAITDGLTSLFNHRYFQERLQEEIERSKRYTVRSISLVMIDIDHFKSFNDTYGHRTGDAILREVAELIRQQSRQSDVVCRYGGEELTVILPEVNKYLASRFAERVREAVARNTFWGAGIEGDLHITVSAGVASYPVDSRSTGDLIEAADQALYQAKNNGRNRIALFAPDAKIDNPTTT